MDLSVFVEQLGEAAPSASELETKCGLTKKEADEYVKSFYCVKRAEPLQEPKGSELFFELLRKWDLSNLEVGMINFSESYVTSAGAACIGCVEVDPLVITSTGDLVVYELGSKQHLLWHVARNSAMFLEALLIAAQFLGKRAVGGISFDDFGSARSAAALCAAAAGGDKYSDFFKMLLGAE